MLDRADFFPCGSLRRCGFNLLEVLNDFETPVGVRKSLLTGDLQFEQIGGGPAVGRGADWQRGLRA